jgi:hypothetical protein
MRGCAAAKGGYRREEQATSNLVVIGIVVNMSNTPTSGGFIDYNSFSGNASTP